jgi:nucleoside-diphosphate-sugar epimerase
MASLRRFPTQKARCSSLGPGAGNFYWFEQRYTGAEPGSSGGALPLKILITGATGVIGGATVAELARAGHVENLLLLVRAETKEEGLQRLRENLQKSEIDASVLDKLDVSQVLLGDLSAVANFSADPRLDNVTHVLNCAAVASFSNHPMIWPVNVVGTVEFAKRMAQVKSLARFVHVGTAMACGSSMVSPIKESWALATDDDHLVPYTRSKAEAERQMREIPNLPLVVARPSIVVGHSQLGCSVSTSIFWVFRMAQDIGGFLCSFDDSVDVVPVDYCAQALQLLLLKSELNSDIYHISAGAKYADTFREIERAMAEARGIQPLGERYHRFDASEIPALVPKFQERLGVRNRRLIAMALRLYGGFSQLNYAFDNHRLLSEGMMPPPKFTGYISRCIETTRDMPLLEQMLDDFK